MQVFNPDTKLLGNHHKPITIYQMLMIFALFSSVCTRIYQYIFHKDLWLDEASLTFSITHTTWQEIFFAPLPFTQSVPLGFLLWTKSLYEIFGANEYVLYFLPFVSSLGTLFLAFKISKTLHDSFTQTFFVLLVCGSLGLLHYSTEFKQYGIEAFLGFLLLYLYIKCITLSKFIFISLIAILFSHTSIFITCACVIGYIWQNKSNLKTFIYVNFPYFLTLLIFFGFYYIFYIRYQAVGGFYEYWARFFLPHNLLEYPTYIKNTLLDIYLGFTPFARGFVIPLYMFLSCVGLYALYKIRQDLFVTILSMLGIYVGLSLMRVYPFGHDGIIGGRLSLYMSSMFFLICALGGGYIYARIKHIRIYRILSTLCLIIIFLLPMLYRHIRVMSANTHHIQQTHTFIKQIATQLNPKACVLVYKASERAFGYYTQLDNLTIPHVVFDSDLISFQQLLQNTSNCETVWILASHFPKEPWENQLKDLALNIDEKATIYTDTGSILIVLSRK